MVYKQMRIEGKVLDALRMSKVHPRQTDSEAVAELCKKAGLEIIEEVQAEDNSNPSAVEPKEVSQESDEKLSVPTGFELGEKPIVVEKVD